MHTVSNSARSVMGRFEILEACCFECNDMFIVCSNPKTARVTATGSSEVAKRE